MPLSSTAPSELFECLTIQPQMSPTSAEVRSRAIEVRDILSSFDRDILPSEFKPKISAEIDRPFQTRPPIAQWTIQEDLSATLLQWGAYNEQAFVLLKQLQSSATLARCFYEKLSRRFRSLFDDYDRLPEEFAVASGEIERIARAFDNVVAAVREDRRHRELGQDAVAKRLLDAMIGVCQRHTEIISAVQTPVVPRRGTRHTVSSPTGGPSNLYDALIRNPIDGLAADTFMLDVLETFPGAVYKTLQTEHTNLVSLLETNNAPASYKYRVGRLPSGPNTPVGAAGDHQSQSSSRTARVIPTSPLPPPPSSSLAASVPLPLAPAEPVTDPTIPADTRAPSHLQAQSKAQTTSTTGSKRSADDTGGKSRRGRKKTTH